MLRARSARPGSRGPKPWVPRSESASRMRQLADARRVARLMDSQFSILGFRFGLESIVGLIPGVGDLLGLAASLYMIVVGQRMGLPASALARMVLNSLADFGIGLVPVVGDVADMVFKSHIRNLRIIERYTAEDDARLRGGRR